MEVKSGDTIVMGSDGVFVNLTKDAICNIDKEGSSVKVIANTISFDQQQRKNEDNSGFALQWCCDRLRYGKLRDGGFALQ